MNLEKEIEILKQEITFLKQVMFTKADGETHYRKNKKRMYDYFKKHADQIETPVAPVKIQRQQTVSAEVLNEIPEDLKIEIAEQNDINEHYLLNRGVTSLLD